MRDMVTDTESLAFYLREARRKAGLTQAMLAELCEVSTNAASDWERGKTFPRADRLPVIARALHVSIDSLFGLASLADEPGPSEMVRRLVQVARKLAPSEIRLLLGTAQQFARPAKSVGGTVAP